MTGDTTRMQAGEGKEKEQSYNCKGEAHPGRWRMARASGVPTEGREGERSEPGLTGGGTPEGASDHQGLIRQNSEVVAKATRRRFSLKYKLRLLAEADSCVKGDLGALLRREGIYDSTYRKWLKQREQGILTGLAPKPRGPTPKPADPLAKRVAELERENRKLGERLKRAELIIEFQKKVGSLLGIELASIEDRKDS